MIDNTNDCLGQTNSFDLCQHAKAIKRSSFRFWLMIVKCEPNDNLFSNEAVKLPQGLMRRFVVGEGDAFRSGISKFLKRPELSKVPLKPIWMDEFFVGIKGVGRVTARSQPDYDKEEVFDIKPGDCLFQGKGLMRRIEAVTDEWVFFYVAIPASSKGLDYHLFPAGMYDERDVQALGTSAK